MDLTAGVAASSQYPDEGKTRETDIARLIDPAPLLRRGRDWTRYFGPLVSLLILGAVAYQLRRLDIGAFQRIWPASIGFWLVFAFAYVSTPLFELVIYRRLWRLPFAGFEALLRKLVSNEILLGYLGEVYFYAWARRHAHIATAPFGAIKDVAILSAVMGNLTALVLFVVTAPLLSSLSLGVSSRTYLLSGGIILGTSFLMLIFRRSLFTLPRSELRFVSAMHLARIATSMMLLATMWHLLLPGAAFSFWLILASMRQLLSRLPLLPNKDLVFVGIASFLVGRDTEVTAAVALLAALILATHLAVGLALGVRDVLRGGEAS